nr:FliH/SctL family protein [Bosea vaviloviae]
MRPATKFTFGTDFREGGRRAAGEADLAAAKSEAFRAGEAQARHDAEGQLNGMVGQLARAAERLLAQEDARTAAIEAQAAHIAIATAKALAGAALAEKPLAEIEHAVRECLSHARLAPHLVLRVNDGAAEAVEALIARLARESGFAGRLVVLGEPEIAPGDGRIEWADGGFVIDAQRLSQLVEQAVTGVFGHAGPRSLAE